MALSDVSGYHRALVDALFNEDPDLWNRDEAQRQVQDARNFLERLRQSPPEERVAYIFWESRVRLLETLIKSVQDKLDGDTTHGVFAQQLCNNPYMISLGFTRSNLTLCCDNKMVEFERLLLS